MSHLFLQPGHSPQRPDWLAEDAVSCEPVSERNSLLTGKFTGILLESGSPPATSASVSSQFNGFRSNSLYNGTENFRTRIRENLSRNSEFAILIFTPNFRSARERISARWSTDQVPDQKNLFLGLGNSRLSRSVLPSYSRRRIPRRCNSGTTRSTKSSSPPGRYGNCIVKPSEPSVISHSSISSAIVTGVPT